MQKNETAANFSIRQRTVAVRATSGSAAGMAHPRQRNRCKGIRAEAPGAKDAQAAANGSPSRPRLCRRDSIRPADQCCRRQQPLRIRETVPPAPSRFAPAGHLRTHSDGRRNRGGLGDPCRTAGFHDDADLRIGENGKRLGNNSPQRVGTIPVGSYAGGASNSPALYAPAKPRSLGW